MESNAHTNDGVDSSLSSDDSINPQVSLGFSFLQVVFSLTQSIPFPHVNQNWILLDTQSSCDICNNKKLLHNIRKVKGQGLVIKSNSGGNLIATKQGTVKGYGKVWYKKKSLANIFSFAIVCKKFIVTMPTDADDPLLSI